MATLADIEIARDQQRGARLFYYILTLLTILIFTYIIVYHIGSLILYCMLSLLIAVCILGMIMATRSIRGLDDFIIYYAAKKIQQAQKRYSAMYSYPKDKGFNIHNIKQIILTLPEPEKWKIEETKTAFYVLKE